MATQINKEDCIFFMHSVQSYALRCTIESLKDVLSEVILSVTEQGIKICTLDFSRCAIVYLKIDAAKCEMFHCAWPCKLGVSVTSLFKLIKTTTLNDLITIYLCKDQPEVLKIMIDCKDRCMLINSELHTLDLDDDSISIPKIEFSCILMFPSQEFQRNIRDLSSVSEFVDIIVDKNTFSMCAVGDFATQELVFSERVNGMQFQSTGDEVIKGRFSLKYLNLFAKSASLSGFVELYLKNNIPLILKYFVGTIGRMQYVLSPIAPT